MTSEVEIVATIIGSDWRPWTESGRVHAKAKQDNRVLQDFFRRIGDTGGELFATILGKDERQDHAKENGKYRTADHLNLFAEQRRGNGDDQAEQDAFPALAYDIRQLHMRFLLSISRCDGL